MIDTPSSSSAWPDFYIIGAPKCGTTALSHYLSQHPGVCFSTIKEPHYFATDFPNNRQVNTPEEYLGLFAKPEGGALRGEGSVWHLFSREAVPNILRVRPDAKFIVMLRNPIDAVQSLHNQLVLSAQEDILDFSSAWSLQEDRRRGRSIPNHCSEPQLLQYGAACKFGVQIQRLRERVSDAQIHVIVYDDFSRDVPDSYNRVLAFLGLPQTAPLSFDVVNPSQTARFLTINRMLQKPSRLRRFLSSHVRNLLGVRSTGFRAAMNRLNRVEKKRPPISPETRAMLASYFRGDIDLTSKQIGRDLSAWR